MEHGARAYRHGITVGCQCWNHRRTVRRPSATAVRPRAAINQSSDQGRTRALRSPLRTSARLDVHGYDCARPRAPVARRRLQAEPCASEALRQSSCRCCPCPPAAACHVPANDHTPQRAECSGRGRPMKKARRPQWHSQWHSVLRASFPVSIKCARSGERQNAAEGEFGSVDVQESPRCVSPFVHIKLVL